MGEKRGVHVTVVNIQISHSEETSSPDVTAALTLSDLPDYPAQAVCKAEETEYAMIDEYIQDYKAPTSTSPSCAYVDEKTNSNKNSVSEHSPPTRAADRPRGGRKCVIPVRRSCLARQL